MADESHSNSPVVLRSVNWREVFPFTNIFRGFRIAVHPSKLVLGLVALLMLYLGGRVMDWVWPTGSLALPGEVADYGEHAGGPLAARGDRDKQRATLLTRSFDDQIKKSRADSEEAFGEHLVRYNILTEKTAVEEASKAFAGNRRREIEGKIMYAANAAIDEAAKTRDKAIEEANKLDSEKKKKGIEDANNAYKATFLSQKAKANDEIAAFHRILPQGIFRAFFEYEVMQINGVASAVWRNDWLATGGVKDHIVNFFTVGPVWLWKYHTVYAVLFTLLFLLVWAVFGGAISRIAAVHVARDEKISVRQALRFSLNKVLSFVFAPLIPLIIIGVIGLLIAIGGLLLYIPVFGPIIVGALFFLALIASVVITLVLFGTIGGFGLMYPTIAVEGSDSFDAISRSFSYVFARPWRMVFYTAVAIAYGALTYLFVRFFIWIVLLATHAFASLFLSGPETGGTAYWFNQMWPEPGTFWSMKLPYDVNYAGLAWSEDIASILISIWIYLLIGLIGAYAISYYLSVSTIIYTLMRREVDATELEDVYVEELEDDLIDVPVNAPAAAIPTTPATITTTTIDVTPPPPAGV